jgi:hypothetical protein
MTTAAPYPGSARAKAAENQARELGSGQHAAELATEHPPEALLAVPVTGTPRAANGDDAVYRTAVLSAANPIRRLLPQDPQRYRAWILAIDGPVIICETEDLATEAANTAGTVAPSLSNTGTSVAAPAAGAVLATVGAGPGTWQVGWAIRNQIATGLADNYGLYIGPVTTPVAVSLNSTASQTMQQLPFTVTLLAPAAISVAAIAADGTGTYNATLTATLISPAVTGAALPQGAYLPAATWLPVSHKQQVFAALCGAASPCRIAVITERYQDPCPS